MQVRRKPISSALDFTHRARAGPQVLEALSRSCSYQTNTAQRGFNTIYCIIVPDM